MLRWALTSHPTMTVSAETRNFKQLRNSKESKILARTVDILIDEVSILAAKDPKAVEVLMRRLAALLRADRTGAWEAANELSEEETVLLDERQRRCIQKSARLNKNFGKRKSHGGAGDVER